jgi:murein DD-endopeptidase MepM/ murein hydrolase activator NlpD
VKKPISLVPLNHISVSLPEKIQVTGSTAVSLARLIGVKDPTVLQAVKMAIDQPDKFGSIVDKTIKGLPVVRKAQGVVNLLNSPHKVDKLVNTMAYTFLESMVNPKKGNKLSDGVKTVNRVHSVLDSTNSALLASLANAIVAKAGKRDPLFAAASFLTIATNESGSNPLAKNSKSGAFGLTQITPVTWRYTVTSSLFQRVQSVLTTSGFTRIAADRLNTKEHHLAHPHQSIDQMKHYSEQFAIAVTLYQSLFNHVLSEFKFSNGHWSPIKGAVNMNQWLKFKAHASYLNSYHMGLQSLISALHINGASFFIKNVKMSHADRIDRDARLLGYLIIDPAFRKAYNDLANAFNDGKFGSMLIGDTMDPYSGLHVASRYNKKRTLKVKGVTTTAIHRGVDIKAAGGVPLYCPFPKGFVTKSGYTDSTGYFVELAADADGDFIRLFHLQKKGHNVGPVLEGELIGHVGDTGHAQAPHIHLEYFTKSGKRRDPGTAPHAWVKLIKTQTLL